MAAGAFDEHVLCAEEGLRDMTGTISKRGARTFLASRYRDGCLDLTDGALSSWPRFLAVMADADKKTLVGTGITSFHARVVRDAGNMPVFVVTHKTGPQLALWPGTKHVSPPLRVLIRASNQTLLLCVDGLGEL